MRAPEGPREPRQLDESAHKSRLCGLIDRELARAEHCGFRGRRAGADIQTDHIEAAAMSGGQGKGPLIRPESYSLFDKLLFAVFVLAVPPFVASNSDIFGDGDVSWHVAAGRWILEHGRIPTTDPFSFSMPGKAWVTHEWLAEILYASAYNAAGHAGLAAVVALALMAVTAILFFYLRKPGRADRNAGRVRELLPSAPALLPRATARHRLELARRLDRGPAQCTRFRQAAALVLARADAGLGQHAR